MPSQFQLQKANVRFSSGSFLRILIVWLIGLASLRIDHMSDFDLRFQMRGDLAPAKDIIIIELNPSDLRYFNSNEVQDLMVLNSSSEISDNYYWSPQLWNTLLFDLLKLNPKTIIITLDLLKQALTDTMNVGILGNPKVTWVYSRETDPLGLEKKRLLDVLNIDFEKDGVIRRVLSPVLGEPSRYINYQGSENRFFKISYRNLVSTLWPIDFFKGKVIVLGGFTNADYEYITPMGPYARSSLVAQLVENKLHSQWIKSLGFWPQSAGLFLIIMFIYFATLHLPRNASIGVSTVTAVILLIANIFLFDVHQFWFPVVSTFLSLFLAWLIGYTELAGIIEKKNFQLEQESETRKQLESMKSNFISLISHDLKNPLAKIQSVVERNLATPVNTPINIDLIAIKKYSEELDHYIRSILNIARVESQDIKLNRTPSDINELVKKSLEALTPIAQDKSIAFVKKLSPLFLIEIDPILIKEALINIIENGIKYSPEHTTITVKTYEIKDFVIIEVSDQGMGISEADLTRVGQKFFRSNNVPETIKGSGLGFFLVKYFIELHSGSVTVASILNKGTTIKISLPNS